MGGIGGLGAAGRAFFYDSTKFARSPVYDIELRLEGHRPVRKRIFVTIDRTYQLRYQPSLGVASGPGGSESENGSLEDNPITIDPRAETESSARVYGGLRFDLEAGEALVLVNGARAGLVEDFDRSGEQLWLPLGEYEIEVRLGERLLLRQRVLITRGQTLVIGPA